MDEIIGTAIRVLFGSGVCAVLALRHSKARAAGRGVIASGGGFGVSAGARPAPPRSGGRPNLTVTVGFTVDSAERGEARAHVPGRPVTAVLGAGLCRLAHCARFLACVRGSGAG
ncbi:MIP/aquaporin family protein [Streptomyces poriticola]|uniref:hypothetical protein n=1 Tax=Streptomyces poriticola TaxID=3120506 RepID=UPI002FCE5542